MPWLTGDVSNGPGVQSSAAAVRSNSTASSGSISSANDVFKNAREYSEELYERQLENEAINRNWSALENQKNREFQQYNSDTSYQRAVKDLIAAGLNPVLAAKIGGSSTPSGSSSTVPSSSAASSAGNVFSNMFSSAIGLLNTILTNEQKERESQRSADTSIKTTSMNNATNIKTTSMVNDTTYGVHAMDNSTDRIIAKLDNKTKLNIAEMDNETKKILSDNQIKSDELIASRNNLVQRYIGHLNYNANIYNTDQTQLNNQTERDFKVYMNDTRPSKFEQMVANRAKEVSDIAQGYLDRIAKAYADSIYTETEATSRVEAFDLFTQIWEREKESFWNSVKNGQIPPIIQGLVTGH